ncbi:MAG: hypothetical protein ACTXOO_00455 [Sodalis sp. (in: enterobacteria)]
MVPLRVYQTICQDTILPQAASRDQQTLLSEKPAAETLPNCWRKASSKLIKYLFIYMLC